MINSLKKYDRIINKVNCSQRVVVIVMEVEVDLREVTVHIVLFLPKFINGHLSQVKKWSLGYF